ncbi:hypothetical protein SADUNF_Sadunf16G0256300 [Salix dunnii]|uniref:Uncharacterized protein n=1 Tax=Salix dunnii TaxID=1413687 RepID=A0A835JBP7_9ROSI|nr:hypothetical protein SADUNF_Sadunf16G0256300 [Salix dunnii]
MSHPLIKVDELGNIYDTEDCNVVYLDKDSEDREIIVSTATCFLRGRAYENRALARQWYKAAIKADPLCYEALDCLIENHVLKCEEGNGSPKLVLPNKFGCPLSFKCGKLMLPDLQNKSAFLIAIRSRRWVALFFLLMLDKKKYFNQCGEYQKCFDLTSDLLEKDPFHMKCTLVHITAAMELGNSNELYLMASNLVKDYPQKALSWFAVGCYYYCIKKYDQSRCYFRCHLPTLYIGMEYMRTHSYKLAEQFFMQAKAFCPSDPLVYNELGVVAYNMKEYNKSLLWFEKTLKHIPSSNQLWESTVVSLAHAYRKLKMYDWNYHDAISYYERALTLSPKSLSTYVGLAYTYHLQDNFIAAITYYHKALWLKPDDQFYNEMLSLALVDEGRRGIDPKIF